MPREDMPRDDSLTATVQDLAGRFPGPALPPDELFACAQDTSIPIDALLYGCEHSTSDPHAGFVCTRVLLEVLLTRSSSAKDLCAKNGIMLLYDVACCGNVEGRTRALAVRCMAAAAGLEEDALAVVRADAAQARQIDCVARSPLLVRAGLEPLQRLRAKAEGVWEGTRRFR